MKSIAWKFKLILLAALPVLLIGIAYGLDSLRAMQATSITNQLTPTVAIPAAALNEVKAGKPNAILVPSQNINLQVADGSFDQDTGEWSLSDDKAHYALISRNANNHSGNTFIYGHNSENVFKKLAGLKAGDKAEVLTENGYRFVYTYRSSVEVPPRDTTIFTYEGPAILTLQTCSGLWDQNRQLLTFDLERVEKI